MIPLFGRHLVRKKFSIKFGIKNDVENVSNMYSSRFSLWTRQVDVVRYFKQLWIGGGIKFGQPRIMFFGAVVLISGQEGRKMGRGRTKVYLSQLEVSY